MRWKFLNTGFNTGAFNMALDIHLSKTCRQDEAFIRLYRWDPYCISLGANQDYNSINSSKAAKDNIDIVKRPTGGRAILHAEELTYSVVIPLEENSSARNIYSEINLALAEGLNIYDKRLSGVELENIQPDFRNFYKEEKSIACFAVPAKSELKFDGKKLAGSAQRKMGNVILQHGSILCGEYHKKIIDYLNSNDENIASVAEALESTANIKQITGKEVDYNILCDSIKDGFSAYFKIKFEDSEKDKHFAVENESLYV